ncbi:hypothetical protein Tco_0309077 [Tanacetum coccineum]
MFEDDSYKANNVHKDLYEALQKSLELDYSNQPSASGAQGTPRASGSSQLPPPLPPPSTGTFGSTPQQGREAPSSSKTTASAQQSMAWTTSDTRYESTGIIGAQELSPSDDLMHDDSAPDEQSDVENNWASMLATTYEPPAENSLLAKIGDMTTILNSYCQRMKLPSNKQFQMEECHKMLTDQVDCSESGSEIKSESMLTVPLPLVSSSVVRIKAYSRYVYDYLSEIVLRRADFQEHTIAEKDFKNLYPSDFEDLNLLLLQVIRQRVEDFQLGIESYQTQLNLTKPGWDATGYEFKHDYTIIESPRAVIFPVNNNERKIMRFNKIYKFSDGTLTRIMETLDYRVKEFKIKRLNPGSKVRYLFPACRAGRDLPRDNPLASIEVLEHLIDTYVFTMKMEILLEPTLNKLMEDISIKRTDKLGDSDVYTLEDPTLILEIMSRRFFLRLNLPDHRSVLNGSGVKMEMQIPHSSRVKFIATCSYSRLNDFITSRKNDPKLLQTLISTSSLVCQNDEVMN